MPLKTTRPCLSRRAVLAAASGLAAAGFCSNALRAQTTNSDMPDAMDAITKVEPQSPPALRFTNAAGRPLNLGNFAGHALVVNLWATWCGPCTDELPTFAALAPLVRGSGALVLPISIDLSGANAVRPFYTAHGIHGLPILLDPNADNLQVLGTDGIPVTVIIDASGRMVGRLDGAADWNTPRVVQFIQGLGRKTPSNPDGFIPV